MHGVGQGGDRAHLTPVCGRGETAALACTTVYTVEQTNTRIGGTYAQLAKSMYECLNTLWQEESSNL